MNPKNSKCLVLNADYTPISIIDWKKALTWYILREDHSITISLDIIDFYKDDYVCGVNKKYPIPAVVKTNKYYRLYSHKVNFSRRNLFIRDNYTCQYCGNKGDLAHLTYDHVIPKSCWDFNNGSPTNWTNIVTSCISCNRKKGNKTPKQANMPLLNLPYVPNKSAKYLPISNFLLNIRSEIPSEWTAYLPQSYL